MSRQDGFTPWAAQGGIGPLGLQFELASVFEFPFSSFHFPASKGNFLLALDFQPPGRDGVDRLVAWGLSPVGLFASIFLFS